MITDAMVEVKANALRYVGANAVIGFSINYTNVTFNGKENVIVSISGTAVETP